MPCGIFALSRRTVQRRGKIYPALNRLVQGQPPNVRLPFSGRCENEGFRPSASVRSLRRQGMEIDPDRVIDEITRLIAAI
jgi:hypothetical protein